MKYSLLFLLLLCACSKKDDAGPFPFTGSKFVLIIGSDTIVYDGAADLGFVKVGNLQYGKGGLLINPDGISQQPVEYTIPHTLQVTQGEEYPASLEVSFGNKRFVDINEGDVKFAFNKIAGDTATVTIMGQLSGQQIKYGHIYGVKIIK